MPLHQSSTQVIGKGNEKKIGSYFRRNYQEGVPLQIPSDNKGSWNEWKAGKLRKLWYYDENDNELTQEDIQTLIDAGECYDFDLVIDDLSLIHI